MDERVRTDLELLAQALDPVNRVEVWRVIINADGNEARRIYRGSFNAPPDHRYQSFDASNINNREGD